MRTLLYILALAALAFGLLGLFGQYLYLTGDRSNPERYEILALAVVPPVLLSPAGVLFGVCYRRAKNQLTKLDGVLLNLSVVPLILSLIGLAVRAAID